MSYDSLQFVSVVGDEGVGKSSFVQRFHSDFFRPDMPSTIGVDFASSIVTVDDRNYKLQCWDTAGKEKFRSIVTAYLRGAHGFFVVYSVTDDTSFHNLPYWFDMIRDKNQSPEHPKPVIIIGCKADLEEERVVSYESARDFADKSGALLLEVSSKDSINVEWAFVTLITTMEWMHKSQNVQWMTSEQEGQNLQLHTDVPIKNHRSCGITS